MKVKGNLLYSFEEGNYFSKTQWGRKPESSSEEPQVFSGARDMALHRIRTGTKINVGIVASEKDISPSAATPEAIEQRPTRNSHL